MMDGDKKAFCFLLSVLNMEGFTIFGCLIKMPLFKKKIFSLY